MEKLTKFGCEDTMSIRNDSERQPQCHNNNNNKIEFEDVKRIVDNVIEDVVVPMPPVNKADNNGTTPIKNHKTTTMSTKSQKTEVMPSSDLINCNKNSSYHMNSSSSSGGNSKMGSRRIFTPQFKLQVLESYRNDIDCKGNQRATARKYNIHRRQIQKWLQCESSLRSSLANTTQNNIKHQFHVNRHQQQQQQQKHHHHHQQQQTMVNSGSDYYGQMKNRNKPRITEQNQKLYFDLSRSTGVSNKMNGQVPLPSSPADVLVAMASTATTGVIADVATQQLCPSSAVAPPPPLHMNPVTMAQSLLNVYHHSQQHLHHPHHHHHHHYSMPYSVPVAILPHPHCAPPSAPHHNCSPPAYKYHHTLPVHSQAAPLNPIPDSYPPMTSSMLTGSMSTSTIATSEINGSRVKPTSEVPSYELIERSNKSDRQRDNDFDYPKSQKAPPTPVCGLHLSPSLNLPATPMDLSTGPRHENNVKTEVKNYYEMDSTAYASHYQMEFSSRRDGANAVAGKDQSVVDLTLRKSKASLDHCGDDICPPVKLAKRENDSTMNSHSATWLDNASKLNSDDEIDVEVEEEECEQQMPVKQVKLFKPYLLDDDDAQDNKGKGNNSELHDSTKNISSNTTNDQCGDSIIWSYHSQCFSPNSLDSRQENNHDDNNGGTPHYSAAGSYTFRVRSPPYLISGSKPSSPQSALSPISAPALSPIIFRTKGSPTSGYETSTSTFSESSCKDDSCKSSGIFRSRSYTLDLQVQTVCDMPKHTIQKWLDQNMNTTPPPPSVDTSIVLFA